MNPIRVILPLALACALGCSIQVANAAPPTSTMRLVCPPTFGIAMTVPGAVFEDCNEGGRLIRAVHSQVGYAADNVVFNAIKQAYVDRIRAAGWSPTEIDDPENYIDPWPYEFYAKGDQILFFRAFLDNEDFTAAMGLK